MKARRTYNRPPLGVRLNDSIEQLIEESGKPRWSPAAKRVMLPQNTRHIDPKSPEGLQIASEAIRKLKL